MPENYSNERIIGALKETNGMVYLAARRLGCAPATIYNRAKRVTSVQAAIDDNRGEVIDAAELKLKAAIINGEPWAIAFALKTIGRHRGYVERQEVTGADGGKIIVRLANCHAVFIFFPLVLLVLILRIDALRVNNDCLLLKPLNTE